MLCEKRVELYYLAPQSLTLRAFRDDGGGVTVVEWAERLEPLVPSRAVRVRITGVGDEPRAITIDDRRRARSK